MSNKIEPWLFDADPEAMQRERNAAKRLKETQWWKNKRACGQCYYCEQRFPAKTLTMDHIVPIIRGGTSSKSNVVPCCAECNQNKSNLLPSEWEEYLQKLKN